MLAIGLGCGLGLGLFRRDAPNANDTPPERTAPPNPAPTPPSGTSRCISTAVCPGVLAAVVVGGGNSSGPASVRASAKPNTNEDEPVMHVLARSAADGSLKQSSSAARGGGYESGGWVSRGGSFESAPAAIAWATSANSAPAPLGPGPTLSVFVVSPVSKRMLVNHVGLGAMSNRSTGFRPISFPASEMVEPPAVCTRGRSRVDVWTRAQPGSGPPLAHKAVIDENEEWERTSWWDTTGAGDLVPSSQYAILCRDSPADAGHDLVVYGNGSSVWHRQYIHPAGWGAWKNLSGDYTAGTHPVLVEVSARRFDFFGLGADRKLYHWAWDGGYTATETLPGSERFASVPAAVVSGADRDRIEVVAVGWDDGRLKHMTVWFEGASRACATAAPCSEWEDLGIVANGPPVLGSMGATVEVVVPAADDSVWYATARARRGNGSWGKLEWRPIPGL
ncbi:hypothetical protein RB595_008601 [Gaeumannomyces hyphopodioides]